jgi:hypothetical protein
VFAIAVIVILFFLIVPDAIGALVFGHAVIVPTTEISLRYWGHAIGAVTEFNSTVAASKIGTNEIFSMLSIFRNNKVSGLQQFVNDR